MFSTIYNIECRSSALVSMASLDKIIQEFEELEKECEQFGYSDTSYNNQIESDLAAIKTVSTVESGPPPLRRLVSSGSQKISRESLSATVKSRRANKLRKSLNVLLDEVSKDGRTSKHFQSVQDLNELKRIDEELSEQREKEEKQKRIQRQKILERMKEEQKVEKLCELLRDLASNLRTQIQVCFLI